MSGVRGWKTGATAEVRGWQGCAFLAVWNLVALVAVVYVLMRLDLGGKTMITFGIVGYVLLGLVGGVRALSIVASLRRKQ